MFFGRVVVFVENLLSSQMGVVSAIRRSSRSADRRRKTQETVWAVRRAVYTSSSLSRLVLLLVAGCVEVPPRWNVDKASFGASGAPHHITWGGEEGITKLQLSHAQLSSTGTGPGRTSTPRLSRRITTKRIYRRSLTRVIMMCTTVTAKKIIIGPFCVVYCGREKRYVCRAPY